MLALIDFAIILGVAAVLVWVIGPPLVKALLHSQRADIQRAIRSTQEELDRIEDTLLELSSGRGLSDDPELVALHVDLVKDYEADKSKAVKRLAMLHERMQRWSAN